jgi:2-polyprenyl-3-methyl-5-hydroxy-6-metoxy-1,4-benzoquinol methylase
MAIETTLPPSRRTDPDKLNAFIGKMLGDLGAVATAALVIIGDKLGLYRELQKGEALTAAELAARTNTAERYVREWLANQAASGYLEYDATTQRFTLPPEQGFMLGDDGSPLNVNGLFELLQSMIVDEPAIAERFRTGDGFGWHEHDARLFEGCERFFRPGYNANLVSSWIPALEGVEKKLQSGATVADVGCGLGASTIIMANAYPNSRFHGFDYHAKSIELARERAIAAGVADRITFTVAQAKDIPAGGYDLIAFFDCLHDMGDPAGAAKAVRRALAPGGVWMLVEPFAGDRLEENLNPVGRIYYACSTMLCTPASLSQEVGLALGAQAGEARMRAIVSDAGFSHFRRAAETPFNIVYEIRA